METYCTPEHCHSCPDRVVCRCLNITEGEIVDAISSRELGSIRELRRHTGAGDGCTCCHETLKEYLVRYSLAVVCGS
jgi:bacterioferritin-associated ferredoxin